jgi:hypothetical protein
MKKLLYQPPPGTDRGGEKCISHRTRRNFDRLGVTRFTGPPYTPDLALWDFWLFGTLKRELEGSIFGNLIRVLTAVSTILSTIPLDEFILCLMNGSVDRANVLMKE